MMKSSGPAVSGVACPAPILPRAAKLDWLASLQPAHMIYEQVVVDCVGMIEVGQVPIVKWKVFEISVIRVLLDENYFAGRY